MDFTIEGRGANALPDKNAGLIPVLVINAAPAELDLLECVSVGGRWVAEHYNAGCAANICLVDCSNPSADLSGATVTVTYNDVTLDTETTNDAGCVSVCVGPVTVYTVTVMASGYPTIISLLTLGMGVNTKFQMAACLTVTVLGCNNIPLSGATVSIYTSQGGTLIGSGTTDSSGVYSVQYDGGSGNYWITVTEPSGRFQDYAQNVYVNGTTATTIALVSETGYVCTSGCVLPVSTTLTGTITTNDPGCPDSPYNITLTYVGGGEFTGVMPCQANRPNLLLTTSLFFSIVGPPELANGPTALTCPPSFSGTWAYSYYNGLTNKAVSTELNITNG